MVKKTIQELRESGAKIGENVDIIDAAIDRGCPYLMNWLFIGMPFFLLGMFMKGKEEQVRNVKQWKLIIGILISIVLLYFETKLLRGIASANIKGTFIFSALLSCLLFMFALNIKRDHHVLELIGRKYAKWVFVLHIIFSSFMRTIAEMLKIDKVYNFFGPTIVFVVTTVACVIWFWIYDKAQRKFRGMQRKIMMKKEKQENIQSL